MSQPIHTIALPGLSTPHRLLFVQGGTFTMGSSKDTDPEIERNETPHLVTLSDFYIGEFPVTQALWQAVMDTTPAHHQGEDLPIENISWLEAVEFCQQLSVKMNMEPPNGYRLPTEAEWEYAAKGGNDPYGGGRYAGSDLLEQVGWFDGNSNKQTHPVGLLLPNALGLYDMSGNVWEWCADWYGDYPQEPQTNPKGPEQGVGRVRHGGSYFTVPRHCRSACRYGGEPGRRNDYIGFRLVWVPQLGVSHSAFP